MRFLAILFATILFTSAVFAQHTGQHRQFYDTTSVVTISGTVASIDSVASPRGNMYSVQITVKDTSGTSTVMVGPSSYLAQQGIAFNAGDSVQVTGSKVHFNQNDLVVAAQIVIGGKTIKLRDDSGRPVWFRNSMR
ncbi:MAG: hypothetical protein WAO19_12435 [Candidatus Kryptoniota bacterium]